MCPFEHARDAFIRSLGGRINIEQSLRFLSVALRQHGTHSSLARSTQKFWHHWSCPRACSTQEPPPTQSLPLAFIPSPLMLFYENLRSDIRGDCRDKACGAICYHRDSENFPICYSSACQRSFCHTVLYQPYCGHLGRWSGDQLNSYACTVHASC